MFSSRYDFALVNLATDLMTDACTSAERALRASRTARAARKAQGRGRTLRPGESTPLWNQLRRQLRAQLRRRGAQTALARHLGLPRQRVNTFLTHGSRMPDAERTLALLAWLGTVRRHSASAEGATPRARAANGRR